MGSPALEPERVLAGRYRLEQRLGGGGMGAIWRAEHLTLQAPVAVKLIDRDAVRDEQTVARFLREAKAAAALRSPHVVQILDYGVDDGIPFIVMELLEGETLAQRLKRVGRLGPGETLRVVTHIARAVGRAHEAGIVHRDLKPENVFLIHNVDEEIAKVLDFGVAKVERGALAIEGEKTRTGSILGTPYYMSPEQAQGNKTVDHRSDLWSLGVIAFESLTGQRPFFSDGLGDLVLQICIRDLPVPSAVAEVPLGFDAWFARAVDRDPALRFQSAREMTETLREALGIEARDPRWINSGEISISVRSREEPMESSRRGASVPGEPPTSAAQGALTASSVSQRGLLSAVVPEPQRLLPAHADPNAATLAYTPDRVISALDRPPIAVPAAASGSGFGLVVAVAAVALALGLGGGIFAVQRLGGTRLTAPASSARVDAAEGQRTPALVELSGPQPPTSASSGKGPEAAPKPADSLEPNERKREPVSSARAVPPPVRERREELPLQDAGVRSQASADGGWVKPAWAIPDPEPLRPHDDLDDTGASTH